MKALEVDDSCFSGDWLNKEKAQEFVDGGYTHINDYGCLVQCEVIEFTDSTFGVLLGEVES